MSFRKPYDPDPGYSIIHPNGQSSYYHIDTFTDPWLPAENKPVILLNHGCARTSEVWYHWVPRLARDYVVIRRDARGHGRSSFPKRLSPWSEQDTNLYEGGYKWDIDTILMEIVDFLDQLEIQKVIFVGEATSGEVGHALAAKYPDRVRALITVASPTLLSPSAVELFAANQPSWPEAVINLGVRGWNEALAKTPHSLPMNDPLCMEWLISESAKTPKEGLAGYVIFLTTLTSRPYLSQIKVPMLILASTNDAAVPVPEAEWQASQIPHAKFVKIQADSHEIFIEKADACIDATLDFLRTV